MMSFAKNECGIRLASAAIILLPLACMIFATSRSEILNVFVVVGYSIFAAFAMIAFLYERAEEDSEERNAGISSQHHL